MSQAERDLWALSQYSKLIRLEEARIRRWRLLYWLTRTHRAERHIDGAQCRIARIALEQDKIIQGAAARRARP